MYWQGHSFASRVYHIHSTDTDFLHEERWKRCLESDLKLWNVRRKPYWDGYCDYTRFKMGECQENRKMRESVLKAKDKLNAELGPREFTLTYSPSWFESDSQAQQAMRLAIERLTKYYKDEIIEFHAVGEYTAAGASHIHAWYHLVGGRKITDKNFKRAYPRWNPKKKLGRGFEGGHHQTINRLADFAGYIEKHLEEAWMVVDINADLEEEANSSSSPCGSEATRSQDSEDE